MLINYSSSPVGDTKTYDFCICGAGAAGITLALKLAESGYKIALFEGGDFDYTEQSQNLYQGQSTGLPYYLDLLRLRYLGGTTNHWAGRCRPFTEQDFDTKDFNGVPGWPIAFTEIEKYLDTAKVILDLPHKNTFSISKGTQIISDKFEPDRFHTGPPVRFRNKFHRQLLNSENIDLYLNANLVDIVLEDNLNTVDHIKISNYDGRTKQFQASKFILAMGAIENARMLLNANAQIQTGIGNQNDMVGRCFMEHFNIRLGEFVANQDIWSDAQSMQFFTNPEYAKQRSLGMCNISFGIVQTIKAYGRTAELKKLFNRLSCNLGIDDKLQFLYKHDCPGEGVINTLCEQFPNKQSRVTLNDEKDKFGLRKVKLDWRMSDTDKKTIRILATEMAKEFTRNNLGRVKLSSFITNPDLEIPVTHHAHQMGTTRMSDKPEHGVVDCNCLVHGTSNLYIAGSSVFATGGGGNPTMPIIQLTMRLAESFISRK